MRYLSPIDHPHFGRLWTETTLNNPCVMGESALSNLARGPMFEMRLMGYLVATGGSTIKRATDDMHAILDWYAQEKDGLPRETPEMRRRALNPLRWWKRYVSFPHMMRKVCHPVSSLIPKELR